MPISAVTLRRSLPGSMHGVALHGVAGALCKIASLGILLLLVVVRAVLALLHAAQPRALM